MTFRNYEYHAIIDYWRTGTVKRIHTGTLPFADKAEAEKFKAAAEKHPGVAAVRIETVPSAVLYGDWRRAADTLCLMSGGDVDLDQADTTETEINDLRN